jgi:hypothetical protein
MSKRIFTVLVASALLASGTAAQQPKPPSTPEKTAQQPAPEKTPEPATPPRDLSQLVNIRLELTITDQRGTAPAVPKTVTMLLADRRGGRIRTQGSVRVGPQFQNITLNVDATPELTRDGRVRVQVSLEYKPQASGGETEDTAPTQLSESFSVILENEKPLLITQSADPGSDRRVKVELKATILK